MPGRLRCDGRRRGGLRRRCAERTCFRPRSICRGSRVLCGNRDNRRPAGLIAPWRVRTCQRTALSIQCDLVVFRSLRRSSFHGRYYTKKAACLARGRLSRHELQIRPHQALPTARATRRDDADARSLRPAAASGHEKPPDGRPTGAVRAHVPGRPTTRSPSCKEFTREVAHRDGVPRDGDPDRDQLLEQDLRPLLLRHVAVPPRLLERAQDPEVE